MGVITQVPARPLMRTFKWISPRRVKVALASAHQSQPRQDTSTELVARPWVNHLTPPPSTACFQLYSPLHVWITQHSLGYAAIWYRSSFSRLCLARLDHRLDRHRPALTSTTTTLLAGYIPIVVVPSYPSCSVSAIVIYRRLLIRLRVSFASTSLPCPSCLFLHPWGPTDHRTSLVTFCR